MGNDMQDKPCRLYTIGGDVFCCEIDGHVLMNESWRPVNQEGLLFSEVTRMSERQIKDDVAAVLRDLLRRAVKTTDRHVHVQDRSGLPEIDETSATELNLEKGAHTLETKRRLPLHNGMRLKITHDPMNWMEGDVKEYDPETGKLTIDADEIKGNGSYSDWRIGIGDKAKYFVNQHEQLFGHKALQGKHGSMVDVDKSGAQHGAVELHLKNWVIRAVPTFTHIKLEKNKEGRYDVEKKIDSSMPHLSGPEYLVNRMKQMIKHSPAIVNRIISETDWSKLAHFPVMSLEELRGVGKETHPSKFLTKKEQTYKSAKDRGFRVAFRARDRRADDTPSENRMIVFGFTDQNGNYRSHPVIVEFGGLSHKMGVGKEETATNMKVSKAEIADFPPPVLLLAILNAQNKNFKLDSEKTQGAHELTHWFKSTMAPYVRDIGGMYEQLIDELSVWKIQRDEAEKEKGEAEDVEREETKKAAKATAEEHGKYFDIPTTDEEADELLANIDWQHVADTMEYPSDVAFNGREGGVVVLTPKPVLVNTHARNVESSFSYIDNLPAAFLHYAIQFKNPEFNHRKYPFSKIDKNSEIKASQASAKLLSAVAAVEDELKLSKKQQARLESLKDATKG